MNSLQLSFDDAWIDLKTGMDHIVDIANNNKSMTYKDVKKYSQSYDIVFRLCSRNECSKILFIKYFDYIEQYLKSHNLYLENHVDNVSNMELFNLWVSQYSKNIRISNGFCKMFSYLQKYGNNEDYFISKYDLIFKPMNLNNVFFTLFKEITFNKFAPILAKQVLELLKLERDGVPQNKNLISDFIATFTYIDQETQPIVEVKFLAYDFGAKMDDDDDEKKETYYDKFIESHFCEETKMYYNRKMCDMSYSIEEYIELCKKTLACERNRCLTYFEPKSKKLIMDVCYNELVTLKLPMVLEKGLSKLVLRQDVDVLNELFNFVKSHDQNKQQVCIGFKKIVSQQGDLIDFKSFGNGLEVVDKVIKLFVKYEQVVKDAFENDELFVSCLKSIFKVIVNNEPKFCKALAKYSDNLLQKGSTMQRQNIEKSLGNVTSLYSLLYDRDVFELNYQHYTAYRILNELSESDYIEKHMISNLKSVCGYTWTNKLEGMFKDISRSNQIANNLPDKSIIQSMTICTRSFWPPLTINNRVLVPPELSKIHNDVKHIYSSQFTGRKLHWNYQLGSAEIMIRLNANVKKTFIVSTYQMLIMLVFNKNNKVVSCSDLMESSGLNIQDLTIPLLSLCHPKVGLLRKNPNTNSLEPNHKFMINKNYRSKLRKVVIPTIHSLGTKPVDTDISKNAIIIQRRTQIDASIVRIMKNRSTYSHRDLSNEVCNFVSKRFTPSPRIVKKRIEAMIQQGYIERDPEQRSVYNYIA